MGGLPLSMNCPNFTTNNKKYQEMVKTLYSIKMVQEAKNFLHHFGN